jgi:GNAT superfamily N-acetyltransferase
VPTDHPALQGRLLEVCRAVPDACRAEAAAICTVVAHVAWAEGDGAVARAALDRALRLEPEYRLAGLLAQLVDAGLRLPRGRGRPHGRAGLRSVG